MESSTPTPPKTSTGWKIAGIILLFLAFLMFLSALRTIANLDTTGDIPYQVGRIIGVFIFPILASVGGYFCLRKARR